MTHEVQALAFYLKIDLNLPNICFRMSIWPNGHGESHKNEFVKCIPRTNEVAGLIILPPDSAQNSALFARALLSRSRKYTY